MLVEFLVVCILARIKKYKLRYLFRARAFYPVLFVQCMLVLFQFSIFFRTYYFVKYVPMVEPAIIFSFVFAIFTYRLYKPALAGAGAVFAGTALNRFAIAANGGKMPAFPGFSYVTGYLTPEMFQEMDSLHVLGNPETKYKLLTDYIDYGYSILSPGDILIHLYFCILFFYMIKAVNLKYDNMLLNA